jgi:hypothetical protein
MVKELLRVQLVVHVPTTALTPLGKEVGSQVSGQRGEWGARVGSAGTSSWKRGKRR